MSLRHIALTLATVVGLTTGVTECRANFLFVSSFGNDSVYQIDAETGATVKTFSAPGFLDSPTGLALSPDTGTLYVGATNSSNADVYLFDTISGERTGQFSSSMTGARGLALSGDGGTLYVSSLGNDSVVAFNTGTGMSSTALSGLNNPQGIHLASDDGSLYVANTGANNAVQRALPGGSILETFAAPAPFYSPSDVVLSPDGSTLYVSTFGDSSATNNQILRYDASNGDYLGNWTVPSPTGDLYGLAITPDGSTLYVADVFNSRLLRVDTSTGLASTFATDVALNNPAFLLFAPTVVPEPSAFILSGIGLTSLVIVALRRRSSKSSL